jgi:IstB-like ATP binding protein
VRAEARRQIRRAAERSGRQAMLGLPPVPSVTGWRQLLRFPAITMCGWTATTIRCIRPRLAVGLCFRPTWIDEVVAAAMSDRLVHHAEAVALKGDSYRLKNRDLGRVRRHRMSPELVKFHLPTIDQFRLPLTTFFHSTIELAGFGPRGRIDLNRWSISRRSASARCCTSSPLRSISD